MRGLIHHGTRRLACLALAATTMAGCASASVPADWRAWDLGAFRLRTPASMVLQAGGTDSQAGAFTEGGLRIDYDFGLYSDPLARRDDTLDYRSQPGKVDGRDARFVSFRLAATAAPTARSCSGVHVPGVRATSMGALSLTVLACADGADGLKNVAAIVGSIRFQGANARP